MNRRTAAVAAGLIGVMAASLGPNASRLPTELFDKARDAWQFARAQPLGSDRAGPLPAEPALFARDMRSPAQIASRFDKVLIFVMESMTLARFEAERSRLPPGTFVNASRAHGHRYARYFPDNQDSRTAMLDMLSGRLIPYEAYTDPDVDRYEFLEHEPSLPDRFRELGYDTAYAEAQTGLEIVVGDLAWQHKVLIDRGEIAERRKHALCFTPDKYENSCEDKVLLPRVLRLIDASERLLLYQEFIFGHYLIYNEASGKSDAAYDSEYIDAVIAHLTATGMLDRTLIVLTSDHGDREPGYQTDLDVYRLPLIFYATRFEPREDPRLLSHLSFKDLLFRELDPAAPPVAEEPLVMIVGSTGSGNLTVIDRKLDFLVLRRAYGRDYLLHAQEAQAGGDARARGASFLRLFDAYRRRFDALGARAQAR